MNYSEDHHSCSTMYAYTMLCCFSAFCCIPCRSDGRSVGKGQKAMLETRLMYLQDRERGLDELAVCALRWADDRM